MEGRPTSDQPQDVAVTGGTWSNTVMGTKIVDKSTVINNYSQGSTEALKSLPHDAYQLSPGVIVYESNPISPESRIYRAKLLSKVVGDRDIAVKLLPFGERQKTQAKIHFSVPHHKNIVERIFSDTFKYRGQSTIYIAMECCDDQNMYNFVKSQAKNEVVFDPDLYMSYAKQVAEGVAFLHSHKVMNRDLKPSNLLLAQNKTVVKIADFGMCKKIKPGHDDVTLTKSHPGTIGWSSPEILNGEERISLNSDIFLLGLVFYFLWSYGKHPFGDDPHSLNHYIKHNENLNLGGMLIHDKAAEEKLIESMLQRDPKLRPKADQIFGDRIFEECSKNPHDTSESNIYEKMPQSLQKNECTVEEPFHVTSLFDYSVQDDDELPLRYREIFLVTNMSVKHWWKLKSLTTRKIGLAPVNYLVAEQWFAGDISQTEAEILLMNIKNKIGTFLIRKDKILDEFVLSLLAISPDTGDLHTVHHQIFVSNEFNITNKRSFPDLFELIEHYKNNSELECQLVVPYKQNLLRKAAESLRPDMFEVNRSSITLDAVIGKGKFAEKWKGQWNNREVAVKVLPEGEMLPAKFLREAEIIKNLRHQNLLPLLAVVLTEPLYTVTEMMPELRQYLKNEEAKIGPEDHIEMAIQIAAGMKYLHTMNYVHLALCGLNVLVEKKEMYKIAGLDAAILNFEIPNGEVQVPIKWSAPEVAEDLSLDKKSDVWNFGVLLYEIVTYGKIPYPDLKNAEVLPKVKSGYRLPKPDRCPKKVYNIMQKCWKFEPGLRPSFKDLHREFILMQTSKK